MVHNLSAETMTPEEVRMRARSLLRQAKCPQCGQRGMDDSEDCAWCDERNEFTATWLLASPPRDVSPSKQRAAWHPVNQGIPAGLEDGQRDTVSQVLAVSNGSMVGTARWHYPTQSWHHRGADTFSIYFWSLLPTFVRCEDETSVALRVQNDPELFVYGSGEATKLIQDTLYANDAVRTVLAADTEPVRSVRQALALLNRRAKPPPRRECAPGECRFTEASEALCIYCGKDFDDAELSEKTSSPRPEDQFIQGDAHPCDLTRAGIDPITGKQS